MNPIKRLRTFINGSRMQLIGFLVVILPNLVMTLKPEEVSALGRTAHSIMTCISCFIFIYGIFPSVHEGMLFLGFCAINVYLPNWCIDVFMTLAGLISSILYYVYKEEKTGYDAFAILSPPIFTLIICLAQPFYNVTEQRNLQRYIEDEGYKYSEYELISKRMEELNIMRNATSEENLDDV